MTTKNLKFYYKLIIIAGFCMSNLFGASSGATMRALGSIIGGVQKRAKSTYTDSARPATPAAVTSTDNIGIKPEPYALGGNSIEFNAKSSSIAVGVADSLALNQGYAQDYAFVLLGAIVFAHMGYKIYQDFYFSEKETPILEPSASDDLSSRPVVNASAYAYKDIPTVNTLADQISQTETIVEAPETTKVQPESTVIHENKIEIEVKPETRSFKLPVL